jgi:hypothetical protein
MTYVIRRLPAFAGGDKGDCHFSRIFLISA